MSSAFRIKTETHAFSTLTTSRAGDFWRQLIRLCQKYVHALGGYRYSINQLGASFCNECSSPITIAIYGQVHTLLPWQEDKPFALGTPGYSKPQMNNGML